MPYPEWLHVFAWFYLGLCFLCGIVIVGDMLAGHRQKMWIMSLVWPITALYAGPLAVWGYFKYGRLSTAEHERQMKARMGEQKMKEMEERKKKEDRVLAPQVGIGVSHCGAGCTLGDILGEIIVFLPGLLFAGGEFQTILVVTFVLAWLFGIAFQYFTIVPMRGLSPGKGLLTAMKVDTLSIVAFQIGMALWMAFSYYVLFPKPHLHPNEALHWFMMQIAMMVGFAASWPVNHWLLKIGWKEKMPKTHMLDMQSNREHRSEERRVA